MIPYFRVPAQAFFLIFCFRKSFYFFHTFLRAEGAFGPKTGRRSRKNAFYRYGRRDVWRGTGGAACRGKACHSKARRGHNTRVEIAREGLAKPRGRYVTLEMPSVSVLDERDAAVIETCAAELRALLPPEGPVLVLGIGNRRVTADALGPRTAQKILVTMGPQHTLPVKGIRPVAAIAPGVSASTGLTLRQLAGAMVEAVRPAALICVDSLCSAEGARLGRSVQFSDTGLYPAQADHAKHLDAAALGVPVIAAGIPTLMDSDEGADLVVTPRALDSVIAHGSALLAGAINRALQPRLSVAQLFWLAG